MKTWGPGGGGRTVAGGSAGISTEGLAPGDGTSRIVMPDWPSDKCSGGGGHINMWWFPGGGGRPGSDSGGRGGCGHQGWWGSHSGGCRSGDASDGLAKAAGEHWDSLPEGVL